MKTNVYLIVLIQRSWKWLWYIVDKIWELTYNKKGADSWTIVATLESKHCAPKMTTPGVIELPQFLPGSGKTKITVRSIALPSVKSSVKKAFVARRFAQLQLTFFGLWKYSTKLVGQTPSRSNPRRTEYELKYTLFIALKLFVML